VLDALRGIPLGVITNGNTDQQMRKLHRMGILGRFSVVVVSESAGHAKPACAIFHHACSSIGRPPEACVFVGDDWERDVDGALNAGLSPVWVERDSERTQEQTRVPHIRSLSELIDRDDLRQLIGLNVA